MPVTQIPSPTFTPWHVGGSAQEERDLGLWHWQIRREALLPLEAKLLVCRVRRSEAIGGSLLTQSGRMEADDDFRLLHLPSVAVMMGNAGGKYHLRIGELPGADE
ncbi:hypothetical protein VaNZ11_004483 [Volvox africanus]|uniref:HutD family protein n=1 Tax=Volvox africanus TaxID=51714 RepID=A0ABQ5RWP9_9CHLO|nr:hypothetical protein VaNZ11_004483 [Volvox africanus]